MDIGQIAYETYWYNCPVGLDCDWENLTPEEKTAWREAALAVHRHALGATK